MRFSLIIAYTYSKDPHRLNGLKALMASIKSQTHREFEVLVVEDRQGHNVTRFPFPGEVDKVVTISDPKNRKFNKAWVMNVGAREAKFPDMLFIDAEVSFGSDYLEKAADLARRTPFFNGWSEYVCLPGRDNPKERRHYCETDRRTISALIGIFYAKKEFFFGRLGGYNENYFGYGGEDNDIFSRIKYLFEIGMTDAEKSKTMTPMPSLPYTIYHNYHHWHPVDGANPLCPDRDDILKIVYEHPKEVIDLLIKANVGKGECPTVIELPSL